jgi:hypothetical protein
VSLRVTIMPVAVVRARRPDLLTVDQPVVAVPGGGHAQPRQVGAGGRLAEELAPDLLAARHLLEEALLLLVGAVGHQGRAEHAEADAVDVGRHAELALLLTPDDPLDRRAAAPAVLLGPRDAGPARIVLLGLPRLRVPDHPGIVALRHAARRLARGDRLGVGLEPGARLGAECGLFGCVVEIHVVLL